MGEKTRLTSGHTSSAYGAIHKQTSIDEEESTPSTYFTRRDFLIVLFVLVLAGAAIAVTLVLGLPRLRIKRDQYLNFTFVPSKTQLVSFPRAIVVADAPECAKIGSDVLSQGGSAVDAAIASLFCVGVVHPGTMGIGGGCFFTIYKKEGMQTEVIDGRDLAPAAANDQMFDNVTNPTYHPLSITVPGEMAAYWKAHQKYGKVAWKSLIEPTINLCANDITVSTYLAAKLKQKSTYILADAHLKRFFANNETGKVLVAGDKFQCDTVFVNTLKQIAEAADPIQLFYKGAIAESLAADIAALGGIVTKQDLASYLARSLPATRVPLRTAGVTIASVPPPASGVLLSLALNVLDGYAYSKELATTLETATTMYHRMVETFKFVFARRNVIADPGSETIKDEANALLARSLADEIRLKIKDGQTFGPSNYLPDSKATPAPASDQGTAQVSVVAENGDAVSVTSSLNSIFGVALVSPSTGIILNNGMNDFTTKSVQNQFDLPETSSNHISPGRRPVSSMCPTIIFDETNGNVRMVLGGAGGTRITTAEVQAAFRHLYLNSDAKQCIDAPRLHHQWSPNVVYHENAFPRVLIDNLRNIGHQTDLDSQASSVKVIIKNAQTSQYESAVDPRKSGSISGF